MVKIKIKQKAYLSNSTIFGVLCFHFGHANSASCETYIIRTINDKLSLNEYNNHFKNIFQAEGRYRKGLRD